MKDIKGYEGRYAITRDGRVWSYPKKNGKKIGCWRKFSMHRKGYFLCGLRDRNSKFKIKYVHRLVAETHIKNPLNLKEVNHKNCNKLDNNVTNLEWCSRLENMRHAYKNNLVSIVRGEDHANAKLCNKDILEIRSLYTNKRMSHREIALLFNVHKSLISLILSKKSWKHV